MVCSVEPELIKIRLKPWMEDQEAFTDMTKVVEEFGLVESVLYSTQQSFFETHIFFYIHIVSPS